MHVCPICKRKNEFVNQCCCDKNNLPTPVPGPAKGKKQMTVAVVIDFPENVSELQAFESVLRLGDKWVGPNNERMLYSEPIQSRYTAENHVGDNG